MNLHKHLEEFKALVSIVADYMHLPESAVERDYYIVLLLKNLADSEYVDQCIFKGGTSLSKCYPGSIERFSEDIDLTFLGMELSDKVCDKKIKRIEEKMTNTASTEKIAHERSNRSKSMYVWFGNKDNRVKLEIGSSVRPDPYSKKSFKSYIHEFLELHDGQDDIKRFGLEEVTLNVLNIERTFIDKLMSVKRHALCGTLGNKVRHIYDVTRLYHLPEIKRLLEDKDELKWIVRLTKETDYFYLQKRNIDIVYDPTGIYDFESWKHCFSVETRRIYEGLHRSLLYTDEKQSFDDALRVFEKVSRVLRKIGE
ncbi:MAG: nucleotidyl transferase AbiEii/AbiGii toxin family protein [Erysipelotrichaceae bacterium]|nr:nucleotidyl transferase AbiEii/AbiGii toxin family protein [Erysipelotrichaceae bacterium]